MVKNAADGGQLFYKMLPGFAKLWVNIKTYMYGSFPHIIQVKIVASENS